MQREILDTFVAALRQILAETDISVLSVEPGPGFNSGDQVITSIGLSGDVRGVLMLSTDMASAFTIVRAMTGGVAVPLPDGSFDEIHMAAIAELANEVSGRAITMLSERRLRCEISPPAVIAARSLRSLVPNLSLSYHCSAVGDFGRLSMFLGFRDRE